MYPRNYVINDLPADIIIEITQAYGNLQVGDTILGLFEGGGTVDSKTAYIVLIREDIYNDPLPSGSLEVKRTQRLYPNGYKKPMLWSNHLLYDYLPAI